MDNNMYNEPLKEIRVTELWDKDFAYYYEMLSDPDLAQKTGFEPVTDEHKARMLFASENDTNRTYAIRLQNSQKLVGIINVFPEIGDDFLPNYHNVELGYFINSHYQKRGYMTSALRIVLKHLNDASLIEATVREDNLPSQKVLGKLAFKLVDQYDHNLVFARKIK